MQATNRPNAEWLEDEGLDEDERRALHKIKDIVLGQGPDSRVRIIYSQGHLLYPCKSISFSQTA